MLVGPSKVALVPPFDTWAKRIAWIQQYRGLSKSALSLKAGLSRSTIWNAVRREDDLGKVSLDSETIARVARAADVDVRWLSTGEGNPEPGQEPLPGYGDTWAIISDVIEMLTELDGLPAADAVVLLREVQPATKSVKGYYSAARRRLAARAPRDLGITQSVDQGLERELRSSNTEALPSARDESK